jgi:hypothetical protein
MAEKTNKKKFWFTILDYAQNTPQNWQKMATRFIILFPGKMLSLELEG